MSWSNSYDDNPFADPSVSNYAASDTAPLNPKHAPNPTDTPAWLQDSEPAWAAPPQPTPQHQQQQQQYAAHPPRPSNDGNVDPKVKQMVLYTRVSNMAISVGMAAAAALKLAGDDITRGVLAIYVIVFACLICCYETHLKQVHMFIAVNFGFLYNCKSRIVFFLFVGLLLFDFGLIGAIVAAAMLANIAFHIFVLFRYPGFEEYQRKDAQTEIREYLDNHPELSEKIVKAGVNYAVQNPDLVRKGAEAYMSSQGYQPPGQF